MENNKTPPQLNIDPQHLKLLHAFSCPSRETSENIIIRKHAYIKDARLLFCMDCGNPLATVDENNRIIDTF